MIGQSVRVLFCLEPTRRRQPARQVAARRSWFDV